MEVISLKNANFRQTKGIVIALGNFDGVHVGHQSLLSVAKEIAGQNKIHAGVFTFTEHPRNILKINQRVDTLTTQKEKLCKFNEFNLDYCILAEFNTAFANLSPQEFVKEILVDKLNINTAIVGGNYHFGSRGKGNIKRLKQFAKQYNFSVKVVPDITEQGVIVSSTRIRELLKNGEVKKANQLLNDYYQLQGVVVSGYQRGKKLGFPTANLQNSSNKLVPQVGTYITETILQDKRKFKSVTNIGFNPTFENKEKTIETYIIGFDETIYESTITIIFYEKIRDEIKFNNLEALKEQLRKDIKRVKQYKNYFYI